MEWTYNWKDVKNEVSVWSIEGKGHRSWSPNPAQSMLIRATNHTQRCFVFPCFTVTSLFFFYQSALLIADIIYSIFYFGLSARALVKSEGERGTVCQRHKKMCVKDRKRDKESESEC